jgi:hypothetical protein
MEIKNNSFHSASTDMKANLDTNNVACNVITSLKDHQPEFSITSKSQNSYKQTNINDDSGKLDMLLKIVGDCEFFHNEQREAYVTINKNGVSETLRLDSDLFKEWMSFRFYFLHKKTVNAHAMNEVISVMKGKAIFQGRCLPVSIRVGFYNEKIYIDLSNNLGQVVEVTNIGWSVLNKSPIKFVRNKTMKSLPTPMMGVGDVSVLWRHVNIAEADQALILAWLVDAFFCATQFPVLVLSGLQGSGKSYTQNILRNLIDPNVENLRNAPKSSEDLLISAINNYVVSFNNASSLSGDLQDNFCCISTGGSLAKRKLHSNGDEYLASIKRPSIINGISELITRPDLLDRALLIELPRIPSRNRQSEIILHNQFLNDYSKIFSGLMDLLSAVLRVLPTINLDEKLRLVDFSYIGCALEKLGYVTGESFSDKYFSHYKANMVSCIESSPVAVALIEYMRDRLMIDCNYIGLLQALNVLQFRRNLPGWPTSPKGLASELKRLEPALKFVNIGITFDEKPKNDGYHVKVYQIK